MSNMIIFGVPYLSNGNIIRCLKGTIEGGIETFNSPKMIITEELKELYKTNPLEYSKIMQTMMRLNLRDYAKAWYAERYKLDKYKDLLAGNMDQINALLDLDGFVPYDLVVTKLGGKRPVGSGGREVDGGFVTGDKSTDGKPFWFGKSMGTWWHEGIGHWLGDQIPGLLSKNPGSYLKYLHPEYDYDDYYQLYLNLLNENHARTWEFRGLNKHMKDSNGNLYIDPNRQLSPEEVQEMIDKGARIPTNWQDSNIDATKIANFHNTFASNNVKKQGPYNVMLSKEGNKIHKPFGHRSIADNGWITTKRLKKGTYGLIKKK